MSKTLDGHIEGHGHIDPGGGGMSGHIYPDGNGMLGHAKPDIDGGKCRSIDTSI